MSKQMWVMQGLPGSGKSTRARIIARDNRAVVLSTDDFHYSDPTRPHLYLFDSAAERHQLNIQRAEYFMQKGVNVVIDNTNLTNSAAKPYVILALLYGYSVEFVRCTGEHGSIHSVPAETIQRMREAMEPLSVTGALTAASL